MSPKVTLKYFPLRARAELIRLVLHAGGVKYEEDAITFEDWPSRKPDMTPFHQMPVLVWDGEEIAQSLTIARYVARKVGLAGDDNEEMARADMICDQVNDVGNKYYDIRFCKDDEKKKELVDQFVKTVLPNFLKTAEALLKKRGGKFFTGGGLSYGDLAVFRLLDTLASNKEMTDAGLGEVHPEVLKQLSMHPLMTGVHKAVREHPKVAAYLKDRPAYPF